MKTINTIEELLEVLGLTNENQINWHWISMYQKLSENFIEKYKNKVNWISISMHQKLSEDFIEKHKDAVNWCWISTNQKLSEYFIEKYKDKVDWYCISKYQKLSENFIEKHADKVNWGFISKYQNLSENFIEKYKDNFYICAIKDSWHYKSTEFKKQAVINTGLYDCYDDYFIAYKGIRSDRYSKFNFQYQYLPNQTYETFADYSDNEDSFGFSAWNYENAKSYCDELVVKVKIYYKDVARVVHNGNKIRACRITILD